MNQSEQVNELAKALIKFQAGMQSIEPKSKNPFFKSDYADLDTLWKAIRKPLSDNGLCIIQTNESHDDGVCVVTTLLHLSGQFIKGELFMRPNKSTPQDFGSAMTYARRYALSGMLGLSSISEDDDGNRASQPRKNVQKPSEGVPYVQRVRFTEHYNTRESIEGQQITFGKHTGRLWSEVPHDYLQWLCESKSTGPGNKNNKKLAMAELDRRASVNKPPECPKDDLEEDVPF